MPAPAPPRPSVARGMALACIVFLVWRAVSSVLLNAEEFERPLGTRRQALTWSEQQRIELVVSKVERQAKLANGYLSAILAALDALPPEARVWLYAGKNDTRRRALVRLQHLWYPRSVKPVESLPSTGGPGGSFLLVFGPIPAELAPRTKVVASGADWSLLGP